MIIALRLAVALALIAMLGVLGARWYIGRLDQPVYAVEARDGRFELRTYEPMVVAATRQPGTRRDALEGGFRTLARYIFAGDRAGEKLAMTTPVLHGPAGDEGWSVAFVMPPGRSAGSLPVPAGDLELRTLPAREVAALRFSGRWSDARLAAKTEELSDWMDGRGLVAAGPAEYAFYHPPFMPFFLRRNEVLIPVADGKAG